METIHRGPLSPLGCVQNNRLDILMMCASSMAIRPSTIRRVKRRTFVLVFFLFLFIQHDGLFVHIDANSKTTPVKTETRGLVPRCPFRLSNRFVKLLSRVFVKHPIERSDKSLHILDCRTQVVSSLVVCFVFLHTIYSMFFLCRNTPMAFFIRLSFINSLIGSHEPSCIR